jgi:RES domain-containing protein
MPVVSAHKDFAHFFRVLDPEVNPDFYRAWQGDVARQATPRWMSRPYRLTGAGALLAGARWSVKGLMPAVYASTDPATLSAEIQYKGLHYGWSPADYHPQLLVGMHWQLQAVLDLTSAATLKALKVTQRQLTSVDWSVVQTAGREPVTQAIARAAFEHLAEGLLVPSARRPGGVNIVYFASHRREGTIIQTIHPGALPPDMHGLDP